MDKALQDKKLISIRYHNNGVLFSNLKNKFSFSLVNV